MKIVSIGLYNPIPINSGADSYVYSLLNSISKNNETIHYYFYDLKCQKGRFPRVINFQTKYMETRIFKNIYKNKLPKIIQLVRPDLLVDKFYTSNIQADIVICDDATYLVAKYVSRINNAPLILVKHDILWKKLKSDGSIVYFPVMVYEESIFKKVDVITTISKKDCQYAIQKIGENDKNKVFYIPPVTDLEVFKPTGPRYDFGCNKFNLLFYGSLDRKMNIDALEFIKYNLIPALKMKNLLEKVRINIFGSGSPPAYLDIEQDEDINYLGVIEDPGYYVRGADLAIVPLKNIGGVKIRLLEILLCGKPIIATPAAVFGLPDEIREMIYVENDEPDLFPIIIFGVGLCAILAITTIIRRKRK